MLKREEGDISSDSISKKKLKAFHLELLVWKKKKINTLLFFEPVACSVFTNVSFFTVFT